MIYTAEQALEAIQARIDGVWDNAELIKLGALSDNTISDIYRILQLCGD